jgi:hypothetical protein
MRVAATHGLSPITRMYYTSHMARTATNRPIQLQPGPRIAAQGHYGPLEIVQVDLATRGTTFRATSPEGPIGPETFLPFSMISPLSKEDNHLFWQMLTQKLIEELRNEGKLPKFYKTFSITTGEDSTGDPAIYVKLFVDAPKGAARDSTVARWNEFARLVQDRLLQLRLPRQPYVFLGAA